MFCWREREREDGENQNFCEEMSFLRSLLVHRTNRVVDVYHVGLGLTYYTLMLSLLVYVVYVQIYIGGGYQYCEEAVGTVTAKVKGSTVGPNGHVWDSALLVRPATEPNALFLMTSIHMTAAQTEGVCVGVSSSSKCVVGEKDSVCKIGAELDNGVVSKIGCFSDDEKKLTRIGDEGHCMLRAWCPLESSKHHGNSELAINVGETNSICVCIITHTHTHTHIHTEYRRRRKLSYTRSSRCKISLEWCSSKQSERKSRYTWIQSIYSKGYLKSNQTCHSRKS